MFARWVRLIVPFGPAFGSKVATRFPSSVSTGPGTAFAPVAYMGSVPLIIAVNNDVPAKSLKEFVELAKAKPGSVTFASASTSQLVSSAVLASMTGIDMVNVPYKSGPAAMTDLIGGQVDLFMTTPASVVQHVKSGRLKALAVSSNTRRKPPTGRATGKCSRSRPLTRPATRRVWAAATAIVWTPPTPAAGRQSPS